MTGIGKDGVAQSLGPEQANVDDEPGRESVPAMHSRAVVVLAPQFDDDRFRELSPQRQIDGLRYVLVHPAIRFGTL